MNRVSVLRVAAAAVAMALCLAWVVVPTRTAAQEPIVIEKYVAAVNDTAPTDPVTAVVPGDSITYGLSVSSVPSLSGTEVTITDVVDGNTLAFEGAVPTGCTESVDGVSCLVTLDESGSTEVLLTFSVRPVSSASACQELVNTATVVGADDASASTELAVDICPEGTTREGTAASGGSNTAMELPQSPSALAIQLGALLLGTAVIWALHGAARLTGREQD